MTVILPGGVGQLFASIAGSAFDPANTSASATLSNNNKTVTGNNSTGSTGMTRGILGLNSGKKYFEIIAGAPNFNVPANYGAVMAGYVIQDGYLFGFDTSSVAVKAASSSAYARIWNNSGTQLVVTPTAGDVINIAIDLSGGKGYCGVNGNWFNVTGVTGTPDFTFTGGNQTWYPGAVVGGDVALTSCTLNAGGPFTYPVPTGYTKWG